MTSSQTRDRIWDSERARTRIAAEAARPGALLPVLHALQEEFGFIPEESLPLIMDALNISRADLVGVIGFYHDFRTTPGGHRRLQVCRAEACQSMGCEALVAGLEQRFGVSMGETTADGALTLDSVYCLGNCALSPAVMLDGKLYGRMTPERVAALVSEAVS